MGESVYEFDTKARWGAALGFGTMSLLFLCGTVAAETSAAGRLGLLAVAVVMAWLAIQAAKMPSVQIAADYQAVTIINSPFKTTIRLQDVREFGASGANLGVAPRVALTAILRSGRSRTYSAASVPSGSADSSSLEAMIQHLNSLTPATEDASA